MEYLEITDTQGRRRRVELKRNRLLVGREPTCDVYLPHPNVSRRHAQIQRSPEGVWILQDLNSLNHVYVGDRTVQQIVLEGGKEVRIAEYRLTLLEASTIIEPGKARADKGEPWTSLGPAWIEQLHIFQRELLRPSRRGRCWRGWPTNSAASPSRRWWRSAPPTPPAPASATTGT